MTKAIHVLTSLLFVLVCASLWCIWHFTKAFFIGRFEGTVMMTPTVLVFSYYDWLWALPVPAIAYSAVLMNRRELLVEKVVLYALFAARISAVLILGTVWLIGCEVSIVRGPPLRNK